MSLREEELQPRETSKPKPIEIKSVDGLVTLKQLTITDAVDMFALIDRNREHLSQNGEDTAEKYPTLELAVKSIKEPRNPDRLRFAIRNENGEFVGSINLTPDKDNSQRGEIGYYLGQEFTRKGYAGRATEALVRYSFKNLGYREIFDVVAETNISSLNVLRKLGFTETSRQTTEKGKQIILSRFKPPLKPSI